MSRYIDADVLKANCDIMVGNTTIGRRDYVMFHEIDSTPTIDAVEVVRCKDCKWCEDCDGLMCQNPNGWVVATEEDFGCILGERKETDHD